MPDARLPRRHALWCYLAVLCSVAAISQAEGNWLSLAVIAAAMAAEAAGRRYGRLISRRWRIPLGCAVLVLFVLDFLFYSRGVIVTLAHVIVLTMAIYLVTAKIWADWWWLFAQAVMLLCAAAVTGFEMAFMFYSAAFTAAACLFGYYAIISRAADGQVRVSTSFAARRRTRAAAFGVIAVTAFVTVAATVYLLAPRIRPFGFTAPFLKGGQPVTGFSSEVDLNNGVGNILQNPTAVFRAQVAVNGVAGEAPIPLYWRGTTLVHFTGSGWTSGPAIGPFGSRLHDVPLPFLVGNYRHRALGPVAVVQSITLERLSTNAMFALPGITLVTSPMMRAIQFDIGTGDLAKIPRLEVAGPLSYEVTSQPAFPGNFLNGPEPGDEQEGYMRDYIDEALDTTLVSQQIAELARRVVDSVPRPNPAAALTQYQRAVALRDYLGANYTYSTVKTEISGDSPVDEFLLRTKTGHCEYFASALAVMLRTVGVPTRVVNGFLDGEYNDIGRFYTVRESSAHSWTEVYFAGKGWYIFDATPASERVRGVRGGALKRMVDYVTYRWLGRIAGYSIDSQRPIYAFLQPFASRLFKPLAHQYRRIWRLTAERRPEGYEAARGPLVVLLMALVAVSAIFLALAISGWLKMAAARLGRAPKAPAAAYPRFYRRFLKTLKRKGVTRRIDETPLEMANRAVAKGMVERGAAERIVEAYYRLRYGAVALSRDETARLEALADKGRGRA